MATENIVTGKFYRILKDKTNDIWDRISFWTHADDVELSNGTSLSTDLTTKNTKITAAQNDFATVESSSVSAHAYVKGNMLVYNNQLYRAKTAIAVGATLTVGTNIEAVSVGTLSNMLTASNGNQFYFDVKDSKPGFYPNASKTASQFVPFGGTMQNLSVIHDYLTVQGTRIDWSVGQTYNNVIVHAATGYSLSTAIYLYLNYNVIYTFSQWGGVYFIPELKASDVLSTNSNTQCNVAVYQLT